MYFLTISCFLEAAQYCNVNIPETTEHFIDNNDGTVNDPMTGFIWKKCNEGEDWNSGTNECAASGPSFTWLAAFQRSKDVNFGSAGQNFGYTDWRLPNINELMQLVEMSCVGPSINEAFFPGSQSDWYWSSTPILGNEYIHRAKGVSFYSSEAGWGSKNSSSSLRLMRVHVDNEAPVANDGSAITNPGIAVTITLQATDNDDDPLVYSLASNSISGLISITGNIVTYTPPVFGPTFDSFTFKANDGTAYSNEATINITIIPQT